MRNEDLTELGNMKVIIYDICSVGQSARFKALWYRQRGPCGYGYSTVVSRCTISRYSVQALCPPCACTVQTVFFVLWSDRLVHACVLIACDVRADFDVALCTHYMTDDAGKDLAAGGRMGRLPAGSLSKLHVVTPDWVNACIRCRTISLRECPSPHINF